VSAPNLPPLSRTRDLVAQLRRVLGVADPLPPAPAPQVTPRPRRVFPTDKTRSAYAAKAEKHTTALVGIGRVGTRYATDVVLQFQAELAVAHEAVGTVLPDDWAEAHDLLFLRTRVSDHREFLLRPDLGRRLCEESLELLRDKAVKGVDVQPILADGLSAVACMGAGPELLESLTQECRRLGLSVGTPMCARFARVWLEDEIGAEVGAKVAVILLGERPGLGTGDGLSAYIVFDPKIGNTDGDRNMISNIHARGTTPPEAARRLAQFAQAMLRQQVSGVDLDLSALGSAVAEEAGKLRAPQKRQKLVETD
jgi:ethanolamine ammonia-lyase small subunit